MFKSERSIIEGNKLETLRAKRRLNPVATLN